MLTMFISVDVNSLSQCLPSHELWFYAPRQRESSLSETDLTDLKNTDPQVERFVKGLVRSQDFY